MIELGTALYLLGFLTLLVTCAWLNELCDPHKRYLRKRERAHRRYYR